MQDDDGVVVYSDTDWAGCVRTRKSTSGGCILIGSHLIKTWSSTQSSVALSSGEAEFYGVVKAAGYGLGYQALLHDFGMQKQLTVFTDSTAALGIASRQGLSKLRHLDTNTLWVQQAVRCKRLILRKVLGEENPADVFTKHIVGADKLGQLIQLYDCKYLQGRAESAPQLRREQRNKQELKDETSLNAVLPHTLSMEELERNHPKAEIIDDDFIGFDLEVMHEQDYLGWYGQKLSFDIMATAELHGRRRRELPTKEASADETSEAARNAAK